MVKLTFHFGSGLLHDSVCIIFCPPPAMFQIIKHIKNFKVSGEIYCNHYNSGLSLEAARQARRAIYHAGSEAWRPLYHLVHNLRMGHSSLEKLLLEHRGQWGPAAGLRAQSWKEGGSEWQPDPLKPAFAICWLCPWTNTVLWSLSFPCLQKRVHDGSFEQQVPVVAGC